MGNELRNRLKKLKMVGLDECMLRPHSRVEIENKQAVINYLRSNELVLMCAGWMTDDFTKEQVTGWRPNYRADGLYTWNESIAYYLDKYDAELPVDFLAHIYHKLGYQK